ncbi:MAG: acylglycerol kinase family protein, partial [Myxococcota bacterium]
MSEGRSIMAIVNGAAGGGSCGRLASDALARLGQQGVRLEAHYTRGPGHATQLAREAWRDGWRRFLAVGGDGTGFEVVNGLLGDEGDEGERARPALGLMPLGTGNSFLRDFQISSAEE